MVGCKGFRNALRVVVRASAFPPHDGEAVITGTLGYLG
jgi:hypothetical protein